MVDDVVDREGPIYFDVLVDRLARAHGFKRSGEQVRQVVGATLGRNRFVTTKDDDREIVWPRQCPPSRKTLPALYALRASGRRLRCGRFCVNDVVPLRAGRTRDA